MPLDGSHLAPIMGKTFQNKHPPAAQTHAGDDWLANSIFTRTSKDLFTEDYEGLLMNLFQYQV